MIYLVDEALVRNPRALIGEKDLNPDSAQHLKALRPDLGEQISFLDLKGEWSVYTVSAIKPLKLSHEQNCSEKPSRYEIHLFVAPPLSSMLDQSVEQATEVGYNHIHFVRSERVQYIKGKELPIARLKRIVHSACKQCARKWAPEIEETWLSLEDIFKKDCDVFLLADEKQAQELRGLLGNAVNLSRPLKIGVLIGPEGGWTDQERAFFLKQPHLTTMSLGPHILRVATAVVSAFVLATQEIERVSP